MAGFDASAAPMSPVQKSPLHSPVPYLFGGLAAMLGLIAFALLMLACSYWKSPGYLENRTDGERDLESGEADGSDDAAMPAPPVMEVKFLVIMAGQEKPTFLATPIAGDGGEVSDSKNSCSCSCSTSTLSTESSTADFEEKPLERTR